MRLGLSLGLANQTVAPAGGGGGGYDLRAALATWRVFFDATDADTRNMSGDNIVSIDDKGTLGHLLKANGTVDVSTVNDVGVAQSLADGVSANIRNSADSANVTMHSIVSASASTLLAIVKRPATTAQYRMAADGASWILVDLTANVDELRARYWSGAYVDAVGGVGDGAAWCLLTVRHHSGQLIAGVNGNEGTPATCGDVTGDSAMVLPGLMSNGAMFALTAMHNTGDPDEWDDIVTAAMVIVNALNAA